MQPCHNLAIESHQLTPKQSRFVEEYLIDLNASGAALRAGYSARTAASIGFENLRKPKIAEAIRIGREELSKRAEITQEDVLEGLKREATNYGDRSSHSARVTAWVWIGKHLGMFEQAQNEATDSPIPNVTGAFERLVGELDRLSSRQREIGAGNGSNEFLGGKQE